MTKRYLSENEELMKEWDFEANKDLDPHNLVYSSNSQAFWKCSKCGYKWKTKIKNRTHQHTGCPACAGSILITGKNDLASKFPEIAKEWNYEKNNNISPQTIRAGTHKKVWWKCSKCKHEWIASPNNRTYHNSKCPKCTHSSGHIEGLTDLATSHPELTKEWHPSKNKELTPKNIKAGSSKKVWWLCSTCGCEWEASVYSRVKGSNCPHCWHSEHTSFPEQAIFYYIKKLFPSAISRYKSPFLGRMELDIFIPEHKIGIEYDGEIWHKYEKESSEKKKYKLCKNNGIYLIRIKEGKKKDYSELADDCYFVSYKAKNNILERCIIYVLNSLDISYKKIFGNKISFTSYDINVKRDENKIRELYQGKIKNSLNELYPEVAKEWHPIKNGKMLPTHFHYGSEYKAWWICSECGYEWKTSIKHRTKKNANGCPQCSHQILVTGKNDLAKTLPELAKEWHPTKNGNLTPNDITAGRFKPVWWLCPKCGHEWQSSPNNRKKGIGCPCCSGRVPKIGHNDLETKFPEIAQEWDNEQNFPLKANEVLPGSGRKVWWKCSQCGHTWKKEVRLRVKGSKCPKCSKNQLDFEF